jgi:hypothetical protein
MKVKAEKEKKEEKMIKIDNKKEILGRKFFNEEGYLVEEFECPQCKTKLIVTNDKWSFPVKSYLGPMCSYCEELFIRYKGGKNDY